jgi:hypothetical protein
MIQRSIFAAWAGEVLLPGMVWLDRRCGAGLNHLPAIGNERR